MTSMLAHRAIRIVSASVARSRAFGTSRPLGAAPLVKLNIDGRDVEVPSGSTILQACDLHNVTVPRFCYHDRLSIAGNCRMCLVEVEKVPKPVASCAMPVAPNMRVRTTTMMVKRAREGVMEFLLANHPLDCAICDQGGECDLQDQSMEYGSELSRFREVKRAVENKNFGPLVKTALTRCIHCTRCVRYTTEVAGVTTMGMTGRGNGMEVGSYVEKLIDSEVSGNVIDLCPVGALTSKPFAFTARPWELLRHESIDVHDALGASIRVDTRGPEVMRILPRLNDEVNEEWIGDKTRFSYDGLKRQRLDQPMVKDADGGFRPVEWVEALGLLAQKITAVKGSELMSVVGDLVDAEGIIALKDLLTRLGSPNLVHTGHALTLPVDTRADYLFNSRIVGIEDADVVLLVGTNPRMESPVLCARLRKAVKQQHTPVFTVGPEADLALAHTHLGETSAPLQDLADGKSGPLTDAFQSAQRPMVIVGMGALAGEGNSAVQSMLSSLKRRYPSLVTPEWHGINFLHTAASRVAAQELGFVPGVHAFREKAKVVYLLGADELLDRTRIASDAFVVYQGHHGDVGAEQADLVLPSPAYTEKSGTYMNLEGRVQRTVTAIGRLANAREDWTILRALSEVIGNTLPYDSLAGVRARLAEVSPVFGTFDKVESQSYIPLPAVAEQSKQQPPLVTFEPLLRNYFMTDVISRNSKTMARCSAQLGMARNSYKKQPTNETNAAPPPPRETTTSHTQRSHAHAQPHA